MDPLTAALIVGAGWYWWSQRQADAGATDPNGANGNGKNGNGNGNGLKITGSKAKPKVATFRPLAPPKKTSPGINWNTAIWGSGTNADPMKWPAVWNALWQLGVIPFDQIKTTDPNGVSCPHVRIGGRRFCTSNAQVRAFQRMFRTVQEYQRAGFTFPHMVFFDGPLVSVDGILGTRTLNRLERALRWQMAQGGGAILTKGLFTNKAYKSAKDAGY